VKVFLEPIEHADAARIGQLRRWLGNPLIASTLFRGLARGGSYGDYFLDRDSAATAAHFIAFRSDGDAIGGASLIAGELCYFVDPGQWGQGFGTAIASAALDRGAASGHTTLELLIYRHNLASLRIAERLGCRFTGLCHRPPPHAVMLRYTWARPALKTVGDHGSQGVVQSRVPLS